MKKQFYVASLATLTALSIIPFNGSPLLAKAIDAGTALAENVINQPKVTLQLSAEKQQMQKDAQGKEQVTWQALNAGKAVVKPGDMLRYTLTGDNQGTRPAKNLAVTQPIPQGTLYILNSATVASNNGSAIVYSIDNGKSFVAQPTVKVTLPNGQVEDRPAPAEAYTHIRWNFGKAIDPKVVVKANYQVKVRQ